jgi:nitrogen regulatory protein P-II 1
MELLVCVLNNPRKLDDLLQLLLELGITGATVIQSAGMGSTLLKDVPLLAGFKEVLGGGGGPNQTVFSVIDSTEKRDEVVAAIEKLCGDLENPSTGIVFTLPVTFAKGLKPEL